MLRIVAVCTGNVCRSPLAEVLLASQLDDLDVSVTSVGMRALVGDPMTPETRQLAEQHGADAGRIARHRAQLATEPVLAEADLIFGMAREHRGGVVDLAPAQLRSTFTLREFARLARETTDDELREATSRAGNARQALQLARGHVASMRGAVELPADPAEDDVIDPYRRSVEVYERTAAQLVPAVAEVTRVIRTALRAPATAPGVGD